MISYAKWTERLRSVANLLLDVNNPRIPDAGRPLSQSEIIADLVEHDKVYELAKSIADNGYYPVEALIAVQEQKDLVVVEGNRRLAALKLLLSPEAAPEDWQRGFRALSVRINASEIRQVKVALAPSREAAMPIIMSKHTQTQVESWSPVMQAKFYRNLLESGLTLDDILQQFNVPHSDVATAIRRDSMYRVACSLDLPEEAAKVVRNPRRFPLTTLDRLHEVPKVNRFLGISFDQNMQLNGTIHPDEFRRGYRRLVVDIATKKKDSRSLNKIEQIEEYLGSFGQDTPKKKRGKFTVDDLLHTATPKAKVAAGTPTKKRKGKVKPLYLIPPGVTCEVNNQRINNVFDELKKMRVATYPNAVGLVFRCLLEMCLGHYLDRTGELDKLVQRLRARAKGNMPRDRHPTLLEMLHHVADEKVNIISNPNILKALRKLISEKDRRFSVDTLNLFAHNQYYPPSEDELRGFWSRLEGLFQIILVEPPEEDS